MKIEILIYVLAGFQFFGIIGYNVYTRYIRPFLSYKLVILDSDDEFTKIVKKSKAKVFGKYKGYLLFENTELYIIPLTKEDDKKLSKRDDYGMVTYYYHRNDCTPVDIDYKYFKVNVKIEKGYNPKDMTNTQDIPLSKQSRVLSTVVKTKVIDSSLLGEHKPPLSMLWVLLIAGVIIIVILFKDEIVKLFGGA